MRILGLILVLVLAAEMPSQVGSATDIGLTMMSGNGPASAGPVTGQMCGVVPCTPFVAAPRAGGETRAVRHHAPTSSLYALAIGLPSGACVPYPGLGNYLLLMPPIETLALGQLGPLMLVSSCQQGMAFFSLTLPANAPAGITFRLQSVGVSATGEFALSPAIEVTTQ
ncbi:MAG: hypothetical protein VYE77_09785 [Planctomycetota bacterium]|nr:hypothetical protein [Planctomycetota bacterium]